MNTVNESEEPTPAGGPPRSVLADREKSAFEVEPVAYPSVLRTLEAAFGTLLVGVAVVERGTRTPDGRVLYAREEDGSFCDGIDESVLADAVAERRTATAPTDGDTCEVSYATRRVGDATLLYVWRNGYGLCVGVDSDGDGDELHAARALALTDTWFTEVAA